ncbi:EF-hand domain-containing protein 1-like [Branchiostoma floridae x Branchiostoma japonicum]
MSSLPFLPGNSFTDPTKTKFHLCHSLNYKNGYSVPAAYPTVGIGGEPLKVNQLSEAELDSLANQKPTLTYGQAQPQPPEDFIPAHKAFDKKVLMFKAYYKQTVHESPNEHYRIRPVNIYYYLEDDSISVVEPVVENSGMPQGKLIKRQRLPKDDQGSHWHWKDLNMSMNVTFYGKVFHIVDCDRFTQDYLESEGIELNGPSSMPADPYNHHRVESAKLQMFKTPSDFDKLKQFLTMDRKVLRFYCVWDDRDQMFGEMRPFVLHYYLVDDTVEVREVRTPNSGRDPFPVLIGRHKLPKNRDNVESSFPAVVMELSEHEIKDWFTPADLDIGKTVYVYGRRFLLYDCDDFTRAYYAHRLGRGMGSVDVNQPHPELPKMEIPPYNGFGSMEDSMQNCLSLIPQPPKKDYIKMMENDHKILRFEATMDSVHPEDNNRRFIISYRLSDDMISIYEPPVRNSGIIGGKFLEATRITKPDCDPENPEFYTPADFAIGNIIVVFKHRFQITDADEYVLRYMEAHADTFPPQSQALQSFRARHGRQTEDVVKNTPVQIQRTGGDLSDLVQEVRFQLQKDNYMNHSSLREAFLWYDKDRSGKIDKSEVRNLCRRCNLPVDDDLLDALIAECDHNKDGQIDYFEFIKFLNWS